jgi:hypothetical protein
MILVAHNGKVADVPMICRALLRARIDPTAAFHGVNVIGLVDTYIMSKKAVVRSDAASTGTVVAVDAAESYLGAAIAQKGIEGP